MDWNLYCKKTKKEKTLHCILVIFGLSSFDFTQINVFLNLTELLSLVHRMKKNHFTYTYL